MEKWQAMTENTKLDQRHKKMSKEHKEHDISWKGGIGTEKKTNTWPVVQLVLADAAKFIRIDGTKNKFCRVWNVINYHLQSGMT